MILKKIKLSLVLLLPVLMSCGNNHITKNDVEPEKPKILSCGTGRWDVKTGLDEGATSIDLNNPERTTIERLLSLTPPNQDSIPEEARIEVLEKKLYTLEAVLVKYKSESDKGYRLILKDKNGKTMNANIPSPSCIGKDSPFLVGILDARKEFDLKFKPKKAFQTTNTPVKIEGIGFFGEDETGTKAVTLHPVLSISFGR